MKGISYGDSLSLVIIVMKILVSVGTMGKKPGGI